MYSIPHDKVGLRFTAVLAAEWRGVINHKCNSERPLVFAHVVLTRTLGACKARDIQARIDCRLDLWKRGVYAVLVGSALAECRDREGRVKRCEEEEEDRLVRRFYRILMAGKLRQAVRQATDREGGGCILPGDVCTNNGQLVVDFLQEKHPNTHVTPVEIPTCAAFEEYREVPGKKRKGKLLWGGLVEVLR